MTIDPCIRDLLREAPDDAPCYVPGIGEVTIGAVVDARSGYPTVETEPEATFEMWRYLATHPHEKPWLEGWRPSEREP